MPSEWHTILRVLINVTNCNIVKMFLITVWPPNCSNKELWLRETRDKVLWSEIFDAWESKFLISWKLKCSFKVISAWQWHWESDTDLTPAVCLKKGRITEARTVLQKLRSQRCNIDAELEEIIKVAREDEKIAGEGGNSFRRMVKTPSVRNALILGVTLQLFQQLAGINTGERERERPRNRPTYYWPSLSDLLLGQNITNVWDQ